MQPSDAEDLIRPLVELPAGARCLYPRGRCLGLEPLGMQVLLALRLRDGATVGQLAEQLAASQGSVSHALVKLRDARLVREQPGSEDARYRHLTITTKGRRLTDRFIDQVDRSHLPEIPPTADHGEVPAEGAASLEPIPFSEGFPADDLGGHWVLVLSMAMNDLTTLDSQIHAALEADRPEAGYFFRMLCGTLRELWRLFGVADEEAAVQQLVQSMVTEARESYAEARQLFVRPPATESEPKPRSWAEIHLKDVRDRTFHYPRVGSDELREAIASAGEQPVRLIDQEPGGEGRRFQYADLAALHSAFGDINQPELRERFEEIVVTAKRIASLLVPVTWNALGTYLRNRGIDPHRLRARVADAAG